MTDADTITGLMRALMNIKARLSRYETNERIARAAPHAANCPTHRRGVWHVPSVLDKSTGKPRSAMESDCACWKSQLIDTE